MRPTGAQHALCASSGRAIDIVELRFRTYLVDEAPQNASISVAAFPCRRRGLVCRWLETSRRSDLQSRSGDAQKMFFRAISPDTVSSWWQANARQQDAERSILQRSLYGAGAKSAFYREILRHPLFG